MGSTLMAFITVAACLAITLLLASFTAGRREWRVYAVPVVLFAIYGAFMGYVVLYTATCTGCRGYQSSPEEGRAIATVYATVVLLSSMFVYGIAYALGRRTRGDVA